MPVMQDLGTVVKLRPYYDFPPKEAKMEWLLCRNGTKYEIPAELGEFALSSMLCLVTVNFPVPVTLSGAPASQTGNGDESMTFFIQGCWCSANLIYDCFASVVVTNESGTYYVQVQHYHVLQYDSTDGRMWFQNGASTDLADMTTCYINFYQ